jgi:cytochrome c556
MRIAALVLALALAACGSPETQRVRALMEAPIVPASDAIFGAVIYTNGQLVTSPEDEADWERLRQHAQRLAAAASELVRLAPARDPGEWVRQSETMARATAEALEAMQARNLDGVLQSGSRLYETCTACHAAYIKEP